MNKKYELTDETIEILGHVLHRIKALTKFGWVNKGELGGYIEKEENLSQYCKCWISDKAMVYEDARVYGNAHVSDKAIVHGHAEISDNAHVFGKANILTKRSRARTMLVKGLKSLIACVFYFVYLRHQRCRKEDSRAYKLPFGKPFSQHQVA